ncbi:hypothetical protein G7Y89_g12782 [Cudoniella acicularis]|uniref:MYND-type domain-containing protein n=1 Tax=Cudoniella acicularis TaxID=354080 RepID=A0A8H4R8G6_9HELO|nr:hypothetical protein G7Y89_g12782 [Cudoniella acicularis]
MASISASPVAATNEEPICTTCKKPEADLPNPLKRCAKCQVTRYCSQECQKEDWKTHKRICAGQSQAGQSQPQASSSAPTGRHNPGFHSVNQLLGLSDNDFLHKLSEKDAFTQLIDCFRLRCEDEYSFGGNTVGIYNEENPIREFNKFLDLAEKRNKLLPPWWNKEKRGECVRWATGGSDWADINCAVEKSDIQERYDNMMPMKLRILGEKIYGKGFM